MKKVATPSVTLLFSLLVAVTTFGDARAQDMDEHEGFIALNAADLTWSPAMGLPPGAELAVIEGDPAKEGPFTLRARMPDGYEIAPHWHPAVEHVTVLSGQFNVGMGETVDRENADVLTAGGFAVMQPKMAHFAWVTGETVLQLHGIGPWGITYVNPEDDPRGATP